MDLHLRLAHALAGSRDTLFTVAVRGTPPLWKSYVVAPLCRLEIRGAAATELGSFSAVGITGPWGWG